MSTQTTRPLSLRHVDFDELYARHLGRHSQFGINVAHVLSLYGLWFGVYAAADQAARHLGAAMTWPILAAMAATYLAVVGLNAPLRVVVATAAFLVVFVASVLAVPTLPAWAILGFLAMAPAFYKFQSWNHKIWTAAADMSEFNRRFPPGRDLNLILLVYEIPICLNYLLFHREDWRP
jgi:hypothetical protein